MLEGSLNGGFPATDGARQPAFLKRTTVEGGVSALNSARPFTELPADEQLETLTGIEGADFSELVRSTAVVEIYSDPGTWRLVEGG
jgi:hypothetical protein